MNAVNSLHTVWTLTGQSSVSVVMGYSSGCYARWGVDVDKMNKWLTLVANVGVIAGIVFLSLEIQQNTEQLSLNEKALSRAELNEIMQQYSGLRQIVMSNESFATLLVRGRSDYAELSEVDKERLSNYATERIYIAWAYWNRVNESIIPREGWIRTRKILQGTIASPWGKVAWNDHRELFDQNFVREVERSSVPGQ